MYVEAKNINWVDWLCEGYIPHGTERNAGERNACGGVKFSLTNGLWFGSLLMIDCDGANKWERLSAVKN